MTDRDKNASIEYILAQGFVKPPTFRERVTKMFRSLYWKFIFWDLNYSLIFTSIILLGIAYIFRYVSVEYQYSVAVGLSPILFLIITLLTEISERTCELYELKQTCRYTPRQITALRCICYSIVGTASTIVIALFFTEDLAGFFKILPLCLGGLFLCASIELAVIRYYHSKWAIVIFFIMWIFVNLALPFTLREDWELFLLNLPLIFTIAFAVMGVALFMYQTNKMLTEENSHVIA